MSWATASLIAKAAILHSFCFGAIFNMIVLAREGLDSFVSRVVFFIVVFGACLMIAKLLYWLFESAGLIHKRTKSSLRTQVEAITMNNKHHGTNRKDCVVYS